MSHKVEVEPISVDQVFLTTPKQKNTGRGDYAAVVCLRFVAGEMEVLCVTKEGESHAYSKDFLFPGGEQKTGETLEQTAFRELKEETGLQANSLLHVGCWQITTPGRRHKKMFFACYGELMSGALSKPEFDNDTGRADWILADCLKDRFRKPHRKAFRLLKAKLRFVNRLEILPDNVGLDYELQFSHRH